MVAPPASQARPPVPPWDVLERPHLLRRITRSVEKTPLTLIRAPAGTGKTVLAADWVRRRGDRGRPVAWLALAERDNQPAVFWAHLRLALATVGALSMDDALRPMFPDASDIDALAGQVLELSAPAVLVIDAVERLSARTVHSQVRRLLDTGGERLRVVMTSRVEPPLALARDRVEDRVTEIRAEELALARGEIDAILLRHHVSSSPDLVDEVLRRTEGWAAGVRLAALRIAEEGPRAGLEGFATAYLRAEILAGLTPHERELLAATTVVEELPPGLAPALSGRRDADDLVHGLSAGNAFVLRVRGRPGVHRLHPLVRELLRADLDRDAPAQTATLHRRAAGWYDEQGRLAPAVRHLVAAGDWTGAVARVMSGRGLAEIVAGTPTGTALAADLTAVPDVGSSDVSVLRAAIALHAGDLGGARAALERIAAQQDPTRADPAAALVRTAWHDAADEPTETLEAARRARTGLATPPDALTLAALSAAEGTAHLRTGDLAAASAALGEAAAATSDTDGPLRLRCLADRALAEACAGHLTRALELLDAAEQAAGDQGVPVTARPMTVELARAWVAVERQNLREARRSLDRVSRSRADRDDAMTRTIALLLRARYLRDRGDMSGARRHLDRAGSAPAWLAVHLDAERSGLDAGRPAPPSEDASSHLRDLLERADHRCRAGELTAARREVARALLLGQPERLRRPFAHASSRVWTVIRGDARMQAKAEWLRPDQLDVGATSPASTPKPVLEPLTERELQVLRHLAAFLTTEEIAAELYISVHTVRTHVRRVLEKLSVSRRHEAVRRGQELGLV